MHWEPSGKERTAVETLFSMCSSALCGNGVEDRQTFTGNLRLFADQMDKLPEESDGD